MSNQNPMQSPAEKTVMAYMEQATTELTEGMSFASENDFKAWLDTNFNAVVEKAKALQEATVEMLLTGTNPVTKEVKHSISGNVYKALRAK
tara:strand:- start:1177 stop:1449 length:273 start_codon:yes stop_codon:yes gene_type:complete